MRKINYHIFGVPDGFNLLSGTPDDILFYQLFYDTSKKGTEIRVNRKENGDTVYSYLVYELVSCKGRAGAFFGMSVVFHNREYCKDVNRLAELFGGIYNDVVLKDGVLVSMNGQVGRFKVAKFIDEKDECEKIGRILINNIEKELCGEISVFDSTFKTAQNGRIIVLPLNVSNKQFEKNLKEFSWVTLTTEYVQPVPQPAPLPVSPTDDPVMDPSEPSGIVINSEEERIIKLRNTEPHKDFIIKCLNGKCTADELSRKISEISEALNQLEELVLTRPSLIDLKNSYFDIYQQLRKAQRVEPKPAPVPKPTDDNKTKKRAFNKESVLKMLRKTKLYIPLIVIALFIAVTTVMAIKKCGGDTDEQHAGPVKPISGADSTVVVEKFDAKDFLNAIDNSEFEKAYKLASSIKDDEEQKRQGFELVHTKYKLWMQDRINKAETEEILNGLKDEIKETEIFDRETKDKLLNTIDDRLQTIRRIKEEENNKEEEISPAPTPAPAPKQVEKPIVEKPIVVYKATGDYQRTGGVLGNTISCKTGDMFVVDGTEKYVQPVEGLGVDSQKGQCQLRIKTVKAGKWKLKINTSVTITFNVIR